jgi:hypothetical protein
MNRAANSAAKTLNAGGQRQTVAHRATGFRTSILGKAANL